MLVFNEEKHEYRDTESGLLVPSVTTILSHISAVGYSNISQSVLDYARARGSATHEALELYDYGIPFEEQEGVTPEIFGYIQAYLNFLRDYSPTWYGIEHIVHNKEFGYCGTVDRSGVIDGKFYVVDLKTNKNPTVDNKITACCQTSAYAYAMDKANAKRAILYLSPEGKYNFVSCEKYEEKHGFNSWELFLTVMSIYKTISEIKERGKRGKKSN